MLWSQEGKQLVRTPMRAVALCLVLAIVTGFLSIAYGLLQASEHLRDEIEAKYTTVAYVPGKAGIYRTVAELVARSYVSSKNPLFIAMDREEFQSEILLYADQHSRLAAYDTSLIPLISGGYADASYESRLNFPQNVGLFAVTCTDIFLNRTKQERVNGTTLENSMVSVHEYYYIFDVEQVISLHEDIVPPVRVTVQTTHYNETLTSSAMEVGKSYLLWGFYDETAERQGEVTIHHDTLLRAFVNYMDSPVIDGIKCFSFPNDYYPYLQFPLYAEYSGSPEEYLAQDTTGLWAGLLEWMEINASSLQICSADHPYALRAFMDRRSELTEGHFFTEDELASGAKVAMVSDLFAERNGLEVGDTLDLSFYRCDYGDALQNSSVNYHNKMLSMASAYGEDTMDYPQYLEERNIDASNHVSVENGIYTVVGIYSVDAWVNDIDNLHPNTVIIPQSALTRVYPVEDTQLDRTFILPNGSVDAFAQELAAAGFPDAVHYHDQGYSTVIPGVEAICHSAEFVWNVARVFWALSVLMVLFLFTRMQMPAGKVKYRLGAGKIRIWLQMSFGALLVLIFSCVGGFAGSVLLYERTVEWMMQADFTTFNTTFSTQSATVDVLQDLLGMLGQPPSVFAKACAVQFGILLLVAVIFAAAASLRKKSFHQ